MYEWYQLGSDIQGEGNNDEAGYAVFLSGDGSRVAIGAPQNDAGGDERGHVRVYSYESSSWVQVGSDIDSSGNNDDFGWSVALDKDGSHLAVGAPKDNDGSDWDAGAVYVYWDNSGTWTQLGGIISGLVVMIFPGGQYLCQGTVARWQWVLRGGAQVKDTRECTATTQEHRLGTNWDLMRDQVAGITKGCLCHYRSMAVEQPRASPGGIVRRAEFLCTIMTQTQILGVRLEAMK